MARIDVITGAERRRRWSDEQKRAVVAAAFAPGAVVSEVAKAAFKLRAEIVERSFARIADHPSRRLDELLPWNWNKTTAADTLAA